MLQCGKESIIQFLYGFRVWMACPNTAFGQSGHALYTCYFINKIRKLHGTTLTKLHILLTIAITMLFLTVTNKVLISKVCLI